jgi:hypothetical protein
MPTYYPDDADSPTRAARAWPILTMLAHCHETMTYGELAKLLAMHHRPMSFTLDYIMHYCQQHGLPPLTAVIVNADTRKPGPGLTTAPDQHIALAQVYACNWWRLVPPAPADLRAARQAGLARQATAPPT